MQSQIALRNVTVATAHFIRFNRCDCSSRLSSLRGSSCCVTAVVAQHLRWTIEVRDYQIDVAIVVDIAKATPRLRAILVSIVPNSADTSVNVPSRLFRCSKRGWR